MAFLSLASFTLSASCSLSWCASFFFSSGTPDGRLGAASRPAGAGKTEIEAADDFVLPQAVALSGATFTGLLPAGASAASIENVSIEIYRVFPEDSDVSRTSGSPVFSAQVPTRVNSPADAALASLSLAGGTLSFTPVFLGSLTAFNSVRDGINPLPSTLTGGEGPISGEEVTFSLAFADPLVLPAEHYFFVPQVELSDGDFFWLSSPRPIAPPGTAFPDGSIDLQSWIRNGSLDPDWLRIGTDIIGGSTFNAAFSLSGQTIPESDSVPDSGGTRELVEAGLGALAAIRFSRRDSRPV